MSSGAAVVFNDPRRFGYMKIIARNALEDEPLLQGLGPEPLGNEFDAAMLARACHNKKTSLKAALLDQRVVAGLGNIYVCEALYRAHLSPRRLAATLSTKKGEPTDHAKRLVDSIHAVLNQAIKAGGSSLRDHRQTSGELGYFQHSFQVYDREGEKCQTAALRRHRAPLHPERPLDLLVPEVPEIDSDADADLRGRRTAVTLPGWPLPDALARSVSDEPRQFGRGLNNRQRRQARYRLRCPPRRSRTARPSRSSIHCQRPRISSADLLPGAYSLTARPARSASW